MKTPRERVMAYLALGLITVTLLGLVYFMYYDRNMSSLRLRERTLQGELGRDEQALADLRKALPGLTLDRRMSLPADPKVAGREYVAGLLAMFKDAGYPDGKVTPSSPKTADPRLTATGAAARNKPPFTTITVDFSAPGDLSMLAAFLDRFYRAPLLHRIKSLRVARPVTRITTGEQAQAAGELEVKLTAEALILDGAENRKTLYPVGIKDSERPSLLARASSQYALIGEHNIFLGPAPDDSVSDRDRRNRPDFDILPETWLDMISHEGGKVEATLWDSANEFQYVIRKRYDGAFKVDRYFFIKDVKKRDFEEIGKDKLELKDANDYVHRSFSVLRVDVADVYLAEGDKVFRLHVGWRLNEMKALTRDEAAKLGLTAKGEKKDDEGGGKVDNGKRSGKETEGGKKDEGR